MKTKNRHSSKLIVLVFGLTFSFIATSDVIDDLKKIPSNVFDLGILRTNVTLLAINSDFERTISEALQDAGHKKDMWFSVHPNFSIVKNRINGEVYKRVSIGVIYDTGTNDHKNTAELACNRLLLAAKRGLFGLIGANFLPYNHDSNFQERIKIRKEIEKDIEIEVIVIDHSLGKDISCKSILD